MPSLHSRVSEVPSVIENRYSKEEALSLFTSMLLIRRFEEKASQLYGMGHIAGFCHLYIGQEAIAVGTYVAKSSQDTLITAYRDHGHMLACGMDPKGVMAELTGRRTGYSKGKGGSMHMFSKERNFFGGHGIVGAGVSLGTGIAFAHRYKKDDGVCLVFMGDGATNQGQVFESFNMAALWNLPVVYIIENNHYAMGTHLSRACAGGPLYKRGEPFGIPGYHVDGMDVLAVEAATTKALEQARHGQPVLLEMETYRYRGHSMSDPAKYRSREEVQAVKDNRDPIELFRTKLQTQWEVTETDLKAKEKEIKGMVQAAAEFAMESELPEESELLTDVWVEQALHPGANSF